jgi:hypothetical protein
VLDVAIYRGCKARHMPQDLWGPGVREVRVSFEVTEAEHEPFDRALSEGRCVLRFGVMRKGELKDRTAW